MKKKWLFVLLQAVICVSSSMLVCAAPNSLQGGEYGAQQATVQLAVGQEQEGINYVTREVNVDVWEEVRGPGWWETVNRTLAVKVYLLGGDSKLVQENWGLDTSGISFVKRTDFADGLRDVDGNGIDDRDPINAMGFLDLNYDGIDDRQLFCRNQAAGGNIKTDGECYQANTTPLDLVNSYQCPHGIICSTANKWGSIDGSRYIRYGAMLDPLYRDGGFNQSDGKWVPRYSDIQYVFLDVVCPSCKSQADKWKPIGDKLEGFNKTGWPQYFGYQVGDKITTDNGIVITYRGKNGMDVPNGNKSVGAFVSNLQVGNSFEEIMANARLSFSYWGSLE